MASSGASSTYELPERQLRYVNNDISTTYVVNYSIGSLNIINISRLLLRQFVCRTCTLARHLSLSSSMVRASQLSSEGCGRSFSGAQKSFFLTNVHPSSKISPSSHIYNIGRNIILKL